MGKNLESGANCAKTVLLKDGSTIPQEISRTALLARFHVRMKKKEVEFIASAMSSHLDLLNRGFSAAMENTVDAERARGEEILKKLPQLTYTTGNTLAKEDLQFVELAVTEHCDFAGEGLTKPIRGSKAAQEIDLDAIGGGKNPATADAQVGSKLLKKLRLFVQERTNVLLFEEDENVIPASALTKTMTVNDDSFFYDRRSSKGAAGTKKEAALPVTGQMGLTEVFGYSTDPEFKLI